MDCASIWLRRLHWLQKNKAKYTEISGNLACGDHLQE